MDDRQLEAVERVAKIRRQIGKILEWPQRRGPVARKGLAVRRGRLAASNFNGIGILDVLGLRHGCFVERVRWACLASGGRSEGASSSSSTSTAVASTFSTTSAAKGPGPLVLHVGN